MKEIKIVAQAKERKAEVYIYDVIGDDGMGGGVTAKGFAERLDALGPLDEITVRINSPGGSAWDGAAIYNALVRNKARKIMEVDGIAASAASFILMAGDERRIAENATLMIHCASGFCYGPAEDMEKTGAMLRKLDDQIASTYASRTNRKPETWLRKMKDEVWFSADEAVSERLADSVIPNKKAVLQFSPDILNRISKHPERVAALLKPAGLVPCETKVLSFMGYENATPGDDEIVIHAPGGGAPPVPATPAAEELLADVEAKAEPQVDVAAKLAEYQARAAELAEAAK